jgi:gamma-glutamylaminecyclotransferase
MSLHKIFVYGTLKRGFHNNSILGPSEFLGVRLTQRRFTMYDGRQFPYVIPEGNHTIVGELYEVDDKILERLDWLEGVKANHYKRMETPVHTDHDQVWAWIYVASPDTAVYVKDTYHTVPIKEKYGYQVQEWRAKK